MDAVAGHIPGAINVPSGSVLADDGTFLGNGALNALLSDHGIDHGGRVGVYCGSGVSAAVIVAALAVIGQDAALFPGHGRSGVRIRPVPSAVALHSQTPAQFCRKASVTRAALLAAICL